MSHTSLQQQKGFTLIELLLYLALGTLMVAVLGGMGVHALKSKAKAYVFEEVSYNAQFLTERILTSVRGADAITIPGNGTASSTLSLSMSDALVHPTVYSVHDGVLSITEGSSSSTALSTDDVVVETLLFREVSYANAPYDAVRIELSIRARNDEGRTEYDAEETIYTTAVLRNAP